MSDRLYSARKTPSAETWEVLNPADEVVDAGLTEEVAKERARLCNEMVSELGDE